MTRCAFHPHPCPLPIDPDGEGGSELSEPPPLFPWVNRIADAQRIVHAAILRGGDVPDAARYRTMLAPSVRALLGYLFDADAWKTCAVVGR